MKYNNNVILSGTKWSRRISFVFSLSSFIFFAACSDFGDRDNPLDPGADNYVAQIDEPESSEDKDLSSSSKDKEKESSSSVEEKSSSSVADESSNSGEVSSSSVNPSSSSGEAPAVTSSSDAPVSSSSADQPPASSSAVEPPIASCSSTEPPPASSSNVEPPIASSSSTEPPPASSSSVDDWTCGVSTVTRGDREYKTVVIKEQCWMQENLRYVPSSGNTMCYGGDDSNCDKYGLLYDYEAASVACPTGWRLPTSAEYVALAEYSMEGAPLYEAGAHFKATSGWTPENGDDFLEFTALPGGKCDEEQDCLNIGKLGYWWTSTEKVKNTSHLTLALNGDGDSYSAENKMDNDQYVSVRCVKK